VGAVADQYKWMTFAVFGAIIAVTMAITYWAARSTHSASEYYAAGRSVSGVQNGWAIAGDYLSAASFLGIAGLISLYGYDGFMYSVAGSSPTSPCCSSSPSHAATSASTRSRHPGLPQPPEDREDRRGAVDHHRLDLLPDRADGRRRRAHQDG